MSKGNSNSRKKRIIAFATVLGGLYAALGYVAEKNKEPEEIDEGNPYIQPDTACREGHVRASSMYAAWVKPVFDKALSFMALLLLSPIFALVSIAIFIDDPGPVFFTQKRVGKNKKFFTLHKFRSMKMSTPHDVPTHQLENPEQYITKVGRVLRKTSLDELPQIWDIFRGKMSIIGPRPALWNQDDLVEEREKYGANDVMPGLTGWAQINGRDELEIAEKARLDGEYSEKLRTSGITAFLFDCKVFLSTITSVFKHEGVIEGGTGAIERPLKQVKPEEVGFEDYGFRKTFHIDKYTKKKVLITGAGSYIGLSFEEYCKEHYPNIDITTIDMLDGSWRVYDFSGYDTVFHVAGIAHADVGKVSEKEQEKYYEINTDLAIECAKKSKESGVRQFIFMSSMIIYGDSAFFGQHRVIDEYTIPSPSNFYGDSKWQADKKIRLLSDKEFRVAVLRPPMIYGKGSKGNYRLLSKIARRMPVFPLVENERSMLYIENLDEFLSLLALSGEDGVYFPQNKEYSRTSELVKMIGNEMGHSVMISRIFSPAIIVATHIPGKINGLVHKAFGSIVYDKKLSQYNGLNYQKITLKESIEKTEGMNAQSVTDSWPRKITGYVGRKGLVSVIMPAYNCERFIKRAVESVLDQTYSDWELIIVDDCSSDLTGDIIQKISAVDERIVYLRNSDNIGAAGSRNRAVMEAKGQYLAFLDSDDIWVKEKLETQIRFMEKYGHAFSCTSYNKIDEQGKDIGKTVKAVTIDYEEMLKRCPGNSTVIYDANKLGKYTIPIIKKRNDYVMWLEVIKEAGMLYGIDKVLSSHRIVANSISSNKISLIKYHWIVYKDIEKVGTVKSAYLVGFWIAKALFGIS